MVDAAFGILSHRAARVIYFPNPDARNVEKSSFRKKSEVGRDTVVDSRIISQSGLPMFSPRTTALGAQTIRRHLHPNDFRGRVDGRIAVTADNRLHLVPKGFRPLRFLGLGADDPAERKNVSQK